MKVIVHLIDEKALTGEACIFGVDYQKGNDVRLRDIGFWLEDWHYAGNTGAPHKGRVFCPWTSALYLVTSEE